MNKFRLGAVALLAPSLAAAHVMPGVGDFYSGMLHPLLSLDQLVPLAALSLLAGQQNRNLAVTALIAFPAALAAAARAGLAVRQPSFLFVASAAAMAILGVLIAVSRPLPHFAVAALAIAVGVVEGLAVSGEISPGVEPLRFIAGAALTGLVMVAYGIGLVRRLRAEWMRIAVRAAGSWVAAIGVMVLALK
jgi:hydrogenase/urease accessory protein HupE